MRRHRIGKGASFGIGSFPFALGICSLIATSSLRGADLTWSATDPFYAAWNTSVTNPVWQSSSGGTTSWSNGNNAFFTSWDVATTV